MTVEGGVKLELPEIGGTPRFSKDGIGFGFANDILTFLEPRENTLGLHIFLNTKLQEAKDVLSVASDPIEAKSRLLRMGFLLGLFDASEVMKIIEFYGVVVMSGQEKAFPPVVSVEEERFGGGRRFIILAFNHVPPAPMWVN